MMRFDTLLRHPASWMSARGKDGDVAISSRVRLARNLAGREFPGWARPASRSEVLDEVEPALLALSAMGDPFVRGYDKLERESRQVLVERHLISREHAARGVGSAVFINRSQSLSIMVNEEDHLRLQGLSAGFGLDEAWDTAHGADCELEEKLEWALDSQLGYLTACPTNTGTGMRASVMLHLPALALLEQIPQVVQGANALGLAVRGLYGEGTDALGNLFQISNQTTLGPSEGEILARLTKVVTRVIEVERQARANLVETRPRRLLDRIGRAYGALCHAWETSSVDALNNLSLLRLGVELGIIERHLLDDFDLLLLEIQPAHLQRGAGRPLEPEERDEVRAAILRERLQDLPPPRPERLRQGGTV